MKRHFLLALAVLTLCSLGVMNAQVFPAGSYFTVTYFSNNTAAGAPDGTVRINNPGTAIAIGDTATTATGNYSAKTGSAKPAVNTATGDLCAMIYVFDNDQEMNECCGCVTTPDGLRTLSIKKDLTSNPLTVTINTGDIKILTSFINDSPCDPTAPFGNINVGLNTWATHIQNKVGAGFPITETVSSSSALSQGELNSLAADCFFTERLGSGRGICSCGTGD